MANRYIPRLIWILGLLFCASTLRAEVPQGIAVTIQALQNNYATSEQMLVQVSYRNVQDESITMLKWGTAMEGRISEDFLSIVFDEEELPYVGRHYKRAAPTPADYVTILPGKQVTSVVDLLTGYNLDYQGEYKVTLRQRSFVYGNASLKQTSLRINLTGDRPVAFKRTPIVESCSASRVSLIDSALSAAESIAIRARDDLRNTPESQRSVAQRYTEWFGVYTASRWNTVQDHFNRIASAASGRTITFICDDSTSAFAYVYPSRPYDIYLGGAFWTAPRTGTDSKAGTIIHELSHFNVLGGTDDHVYGQSGARSLARSNPARAVNNADSHEYFAENTPSLSMPAPDSGGTEPEPDPDPETDPDDPDSEPGDPEPEPQPEPEQITPVIVQILEMLLLDE